MNYKTKKKRTHNSTTKKMLLYVAIISHYITIVMYAGKQAD